MPSIADAADHAEIAVVEPAPDVGGGDGADDPGDEQMARSTPRPANSRCSASAAPKPETKAKKVEPIVQ